MRLQRQQLRRQSASVGTISPFSHFSTRHVDHFVKCLCCSVKTRAYSGLWCRTELGSNRGSATEIVTRRKTRNELVWRLTNLVMNGTFSSLNVELNGSTRGWPWDRVPLQRERMAAWLSCRFGLGLRRRKG
ncbi:unnamed protein product [Protopolystoma xenopodis]|uniref:Uncharacterized protein n=1 Tax=Protopolystoma xenopodis TaxID=117903 RepID=A0A448WYU8_9PLAT|nr:unnamed protein product [Protopolystoma xenopodis]